MRGRRAPTRTGGVATEQEGYGDVAPRGNAMRSPQLGLPLLVALAIGAMLFLMRGGSSSSTEAAYTSVEGEVEAYTSMREVEARLKSIHKKTQDQGSRLRGGDADGEGVNARLKLPKSSIVQTRSNRKVAGQGSPKRYTVSPKRPFSSDSDALWIAKHRMAALSTVHANSKGSSDGLWIVTLADGARGQFRPVAATEAVIASNAAKELLAFHVDRELGLFRSPPMVGRCFDAAKVRALAPDLARRSRDSSGKICGTLTQHVNGVTDECARLQRSFCQFCHDPEGLRDIVDLAIFDYLTVHEDRRWEYGRHPWYTHAGAFDGCERCTAVKPSITLTHMHCVGPNGPLVFVSNHDAWRNPGWKPSLAHASHGIFDGLCGVHSTTQKSLARLARLPEGQLTKRIVARAVRSSDELLGEHLMSLLIAHRDKGKALRTIGKRAAVLDKHLRECEIDRPRWLASINSRKNDKLEKEVYEKTFHIPFDEGDGGSPGSNL